MTVDLNLFPSQPVLNDMVNAVLIFVVAWLVSRLVRIIFSAVEKRVTRRTRTELDDRVLKAVRGPVVVWIWVLGLKWALQSLHVGAFGLFTGEADVISQNWDSAIDGFFYVVLAMVIVTLATRTFNAAADWYINRIAVKTESRVDDEIIPLIKRIFQIIAWVVAAIIVFDHFGISVSSLVVTLGAGSLAIALAAQETLSNMIAGFVLFVDRPFRVGDRILLENATKGDVVEIGLRSTKILTFENTIMVVPNAQIVKEKVTNLSYPDPKIRVMVDFGVAYGTDLEEVKKIVLGVAKEHPKILEDPEPRVYFIDFGDSSLNMRLVSRTADYKEQWITAEEIRMGIWGAFREDGIEIPFPQRDVWFRNRPSEE
ncbi:MAG: mechanosensitive ion channel [Candidatus Latescibacteria bacterium]|nr:mechanosensitive ion channel [Candidatus Latescibacterota bacterium]